ncbi:1-hydroxycarotenoid 3,4-desaturase [Rhodothalassium salexigens DSM 2132]|uniref:1-hydroxycarotenoid 3,4-desaturase n=1 Tax=Rhodothalassium salexigens DSM 2132 TaxID=1188247 RepID=A0A4V2SPS4_RHOSA|nr:1-hydroxycarotenoid 3,4-desaturase CrtD [Rhodothalassium salexigens]MBB4211016.1 1-hydroxycarotenoid 3,4-desaturase [Rhodothalassium salexigens DSM 2132]MBK1639702.1 CrtD protein [Rhodothalassium salexigens DSM 2132]TCP36326.1 1-hydroxycarotenoid 3,4-desaturase [Rhodothalassium salexigens DSM 2132]
MSHVIVVGAGMGGLAAAADLAARGARVTLVEKAPAPGGKMRRLDPGGGETAAAGAVGNDGIDAGPTVFTMRWVFEGLFDDAGASFERYVSARPADILARHAWDDGGRLDLFADLDRSAAAVEAFAGPEDAAGFRAFAARSAEIAATLTPPFMAAERPGPLSLVRRVGFDRLGAMLRIDPFSTLWGALGRYFSDPRLRQLFGRYATYVGSSPFEGPATLMLIAQVEQEGVWLVDGGMHALARAVERLGRDRGAVYRYGSGVARIVVEGGRAVGVELDSGERLTGDAVVFNGDVSALAGGLLGASARPAARAVPARARGLSAITWATRAHTDGFDLHRHNVFFSADYADEFDAVFKRRDITRRPTVYVCAQDRGEGREGKRGEERGAERLLLLVNAPPDGDRGELAPAMLDHAEREAWELMAACGLRLDRPDAAPTVRTTPAGFERLFPATGGGLYGRRVQGSLGTFKRAGAVTRLPGLYCCGGSVHPGPGVPMAALSGRIAAARALDDLAARRRGVVALDTPFGRLGG